MIYLDNASTTRKKPNCVLKALISGATKFSANPGRSGHKLSLDAAVEIVKTREVLMEYFGASKIENVIFTSGCTESLNLAILGTVKKGGHVIATAFEHNSVLRPLFELQKNGIIELTIVEPEHKEKITKADIAKHLKPNTYMVITIHVSNVDGAETDIDEIGKFCTENNLIYLVDAAQSAGHKCINMQKQNINLLSVAGHKGMLACQGSGALIVNNVNLKPIKFGGTGTDSISVYQPSDGPECFEAGTLATPSILSLKAGTEFVMKHQKEIEEKMERQTKMLLDGIKHIKNIKIYTDYSNLNGVVAFNIGDIPSTEIAQIFDDKFGICIRGGLQCAPLKHKFLGTEQQGIVRVSLSYFTEDREIEMFIKALKNIHQFV